jgi:hypothetical protein
MPVVFADWMHSAARTSGPTLLELRCCCCCCRYCLAGVLSLKAGMYRQAAFALEEVLYMGVSAPLLFGIFKD